jgi:hypothetical protein
MDKLKLTTFSDLLIFHTAKLQSDQNEIIALRI